MNNEKTSNILFYIPILYFFLKIGLVFIKENNLFSIPATLIVGIIFIFLYLCKKKTIVFDKSFFSFLFYSIFISLVYIATTNSNYKLTVKSYLCQIFISFVAFVIYKFLSEENSLNKARLAKILLLIILVSAVYTAYVATTSDNLHIIRDAASGRVDDNYATYGGFSFIYGLVVVYTITLAYLRQSSATIKNSTKIFLIGFLIIIAYTIIISAYTTAFIIVFAGTVIQVFKKTSVKFLILFLAALVILFLPELLVSIIKAMDFLPKITSERIISILLSKETTGEFQFISISGRLDKLYNDWQIIKENPFLGGYINNTMIRFGDHTQWIGNLARYGIFAEMLLWSTFIGIYKQAGNDETLSSISKKCFKSGLIVCLIIGFFNPIELTFVLTPVFLLSPIIDEIR
ncbi:MAG: hypothetical protein E7561_03240 [Ruminococcaceae bacterium]|nr:hypothetical protein [Oscillospiraceae bacterium]